MEPVEIFHHPQPETTHGNGNCSGCGLPFYTHRAGHDRPDRAVSTGIDIFTEGTIIFCEWCVKQLAATLGLEEPKPRREVPQGLNPAQQLAVNEFLAAAEAAAKALA